MSTKTRNVRRNSVVAELNQSTRLLGNVITWDGPYGEVVKHKTVVQALKDSGLDEKFAREFDSKTAWSRAYRKLEGEDGLIEVVRSDKDEAVFQFTRKFLIENATTNETELEYRKEVFLRLDLSTGKVSSTNTDLASQAQELLDRAVEDRTVSDITGILKKIFAQQADLPSLRGAGGVYLVLNEHIPLLEKAEQFVAKLGAGWRVNRFPVPEGTSYGDQAVQTAVEDYLRDMINNHKKNIEGFTLSTRSGSIEQKVEALNETRIKIEAYAQYLGDLKDKLLEEVLDGQKLLLKTINDLSEQRKNGAIVTGYDRFGCRNDTNTARINACLTMEGKTDKQLVDEAGLTAKGYGWPHLDRLADKGQIIKEGAGKSATYRLKFE